MKPVFFCYAALLIYVSLASSQAVGACDAEVWMYSSASKKCEQLSAGCPDRKTKFASNKECLSKKAPGNFRSEYCYRPEVTSGECRKLRSPKSRKCVYPDFQNLQMCSESSAEKTE